MNCDDQIDATRTDDVLQALGDLAEDLSGLASDVVALRPLPGLNRPMDRDTKLRWNRLRVLAASYCGLLKATIGEMRTEGAA